MRPCQAAAVLAVLPAAAMASVGAAAPGAAAPSLPATLSALAVPHRSWSFERPLGGFDLESAQRGYAVYAQACASCHSMRQLRFRDLSGLGLDRDEVNAIAAGRASTPSATKPDGRFPQPYADDAAARAANNGAVPPDLSRLARTVPGGASFIDAYLTGFRPTPPGVAFDPGMHYNLYVPGRAVAMPNPLHDGQLTFAGGGTATAADMAADVSTFLAWSAYPNLVERKRLGIRVLVYLVLLLGLVVVVKKRVWSNVGA